MKELPLKSQKIQLLAEKLNLTAQRFLNGGFSVIRLSEKGVQIVNDMNPIHAEMFLRGATWSRTSH